MLVCATRGAGSRVVVRRSISSLVLDHCAVPTSSTPRTSIFYVLIVSCRTGTCGVIKNWFFYPCPYLLAFLTTPIRCVLILPFSVFIKCILPAPYLYPNKSCLRIPGLPIHQSPPPSLQHNLEVLARLEPSQAASQLLTPGAYVRVHLHPKRFPAAYHVDWAARLLHVDEHHVVVDKPNGVPSIPTRDNMIENVLTQV